MNHKVLQKLSLDKESISTLNDIQMDAAMGGSGAISAAASTAASYIAAGLAGAGTEGWSLLYGGAITGACAYVGYESCEWVTDAYYAYTDWYNQNTWSNNYSQNSTNSMYRENGACMLPDVVVTP